MVRRRNGAVGVPGLVGGVKEPWMCRWSFRGSRSSEPSGGISGCATGARPSSDTELPLTAAGQRFDRIRMQPVPLDQP